MLNLWKHNKMSSQECSKKKSVHVGSIMNVLNITPLTLNGFHFRNLSNQDKDIKEPNVLCSEYFVKVKPLNV